MVISKYLLALSVNLHGGQKTIVFLLNVKRAAKWQLPGDDRILKERHGLIDHRYRVVKYLLFSKSGFSDWILEQQDKEDMLAIDLEEMYDIKI